MCENDRWNVLFFRAPRVSATKALLKRKGSCKKKTGLVWERRRYRESERESETGRETGRDRERKG